MSDDDTPVSSPDNPSSDSKAADAARSTRGPLAWFTRNSVAANMLMLVLLAGGLLSTCGVKREVFPEFDLDIILITVPYPGAKPDAVETGVVAGIEEAVRGVDGVKRVTSTSLDSAAFITVTLLLGTDADQALNDIKAAVDRITTRPADAERPTIFMVRNRFQVISLALHGKLSDDPTLNEKALHALAERTRDELLQDDGITVVEIEGTRAPEISIEVPQSKLLETGLTAQQIAQIISSDARDVPAGVVKTPKGDVSVQVSERRERGDEFEDMSVITTPDGVIIRLSDIANVRDSFEDNDISSTFNGEPAVLINVFRVGDQTPLSISADVRGYIEENKTRMPPGVSMTPYFDTSELYEGRMSLLQRNAILGLILVIIVLGIFLDLKVAFWVTMGIPISFIGAFLVLPSTGVSINMISLFAFIVVLGMVVDDAIIVGEAIYKRRQDGMPRMAAAIAGVREVAVPVTFAILTTMVAYAPMLFVPGSAGKFFIVIPIVVIVVLVMSLVESLFILPAHLAHSEPASGGVFGWIHARQQVFSRALERWVERFYVPIVRAATKRRYLTLSVAFCLFVSTCGLLAGGRVQQEFLPKVENDVILAQADLPYGTPVEQTREVSLKMVKFARDIIDKHGGPDGLLRGIYAKVGEGSINLDPGRAGAFDMGGHLTSIQVTLVEGGQRDLRTLTFVREWRARIEAEIPGIDRLSFQYETGPAGGAPVSIVLTHPDSNRLRLAAKELAASIGELSGTYEVNDGFDIGNEQFDLRVRPEAEAMQLNRRLLAGQLRGAIYGAEALRQQKGREEQKVFVRLPKSERETEFDIEEIYLRTAQNGVVRTGDAASVERGRSDTAIRRVDGRQAVTVTAQVDRALGNTDEINDKIYNDTLPALLAKYDGLTFDTSGAAKDQEEIQRSLMVGGVMAIVAIWALLAVVFRSYFFQPAIIIFGAIPFGFIGAVWGHVLLGYDFSLMSQMGIVALSGVVVNDSLIMIVSINRYVAEDGMSPYEAAVAGGARRFRPIVLTSLTTFFGLMPMLLETSTQARFLIPMAISLGFGVLAATAITLIMVPAIYLLTVDAKNFGGRVKKWYRAQYRESIES